MHSARSRQLDLPKSTPKIRLRTRQLRVGHAEIFRHTGTLFSGHRSALWLHGWSHAKLIVRGLRPRSVYDLFLQRAGPDGFASILPEGIHGGTIESLEERNDPAKTMRCND
jgi:hypothetical protein